MASDLSSARGGGEELGRSIAACVLPPVIGLVYAALIGETCCLQPTIAGPGVVSIMVAPPTYTSTPHLPSGVANSASYPKTRLVVTVPTWQESYLSYVTGV